MDGKCCSNTCFLFILVVHMKCLSACSQKSGVYTYGENCAFSCNCKNTTEECNVTTGQCLTSGCADGWVGPGCHFADIRFDYRNSRQGDNVWPHRYSDEALKPNNCSMTSNTPTDSGRFWRVWLPVGTQQIVRGSLLRTMTNKTGFFQGFKFFVDVVNGNIEEHDFNRVNVVKKQLCHEQAAISPITPPVIEVLCDTGPLIGNNMRFVLSTNSAQLVLCDVHVYGECQENVCGKHCETACHCQAPVSDDDKISGVCSNGCIGRWTSVNGTTGLCNLECTSSQWGPSCLKTCGSCRYGEECNVTSGICPKYCELGYTSLFCNKSCDDGKYGYDCAEDCGHCLAGAACNKTNGICPNNLCEPGWKGSWCNETCPIGNYGFGCSSKCSGHCKDHGNHCNHTNGGCQEGCKAGWKGFLCDEACPIGNYGLGCSSKCSGHCKDHGNYCNHTNGGCQEGCKAGWKGFLCDEACEPGKWGTGCLNECGYCLKSTCNAVTGYCDVAGCSSGYQNTSHCVAECADYLYGLNCQFECGSNCEDGVPCDKAMGQCLSGCRPGFTGRFCDQECKPGFYGKGCQLNCSGHCVNDEPCERVSGNCQNGCQSQFTGNRCDIEMLEQHQEATSSIGLIAGGVVATVIIIALAIVAIFLWRRLNQLKSSQAISRNTNPASNYTSNTSQHEGRSTYDELNWSNSQCTNIELE